MSAALPRRTFLVASAAAAVVEGLHAQAATEQESSMTTSPFWPNGARLAVSLSLMFEGGGQPISGAGGVIPDPIEKGVPDLPTNAFFAYGHYEGIPRVLDLMDKHGIKLSSFMIGKAVETSPDLAREIVRRGHEAAAHGQIWDNSYQLSRDEEKRFIADSVETIHKVTASWRRCRISAFSITSTSRAKTSRSSSRCAGGTSSPFPIRFI